MAHGAGVVTITMQTCAGTYQSYKTTTGRRKMAHTRQRPSAIKPSYDIQLKHTLLLLGGTPFQHFGNTTLFWLLTTQPANLQIHQHSCMGPPGRVALLASPVARLAALVARSVEVVARWEGTRDGGLCNTTLS